MTKVTAQACLITGSLQGYSLQGDVKKNSYSVKPLTDQSDGDRQDDQNAGQLALYLRESRVLLIPARLSHTLMDRHV